MLGKLEMVSEARAEREGSCALCRLQLCGRGWTGSGQPDSLLALCPGTGVLLQSSLRALPWSAAVLPGRHL